MYVHCTSIYRKKEIQIKNEIDRKNAEKNVKRKIDRNIDRQIQRTRSKYRKKIFRLETGEQIAKMITRIAFQGRFKVDQNLPEIGIVETKISR